MIGAAWDLWVWLGFMWREFTERPAWAILDLLGKGPGPRR